MTQRKLMQIKNARLLILHLEQDDAEIISRFLILARDPIISRADKPFKVNIPLTCHCGFIFLQNLCIQTLSINFRQV